MQRCFFVSLNKFQLYSAVCGRRIPEYAFKAGQWFAGFHSGDYGLGCPIQLNYQCNRESEKTDC
jgi:hypothetical protein